MNNSSNVMATAINETKTDTLVDLNIHADDNFEKKSDDVVQVDKQQYDKRCIKDLRVLLKICDTENKDLIRQLRQYEDELQQRQHHSVSMLPVPRTLPAATPQEKQHSPFPIESRGVQIPKVLSFGLPFNADNNIPVIGFERLHPSVFQGATSLYKTRRERGQGDTSSVASSASLTERRQLQSEVAMLKEEMDRLRSYIPGLSSGNSTLPKWPRASPFSAPAVKPRATELKQYSGVDDKLSPNQWLEQCETVLYGNRLSDLDFLSNWLPQLLIKRAFKWWLARRDSFKSWLEFKTAFLDRWHYQITDVDLLAAEFEAKKQSAKNVGDYISTCIKIVEKLSDEVAESIQVRAIFTGLRFATCHALKIQNFNSIEELRAAAHRCEIATSACPTDDLQQRGKFDGKKNGSSNSNKANSGKGGSAKVKCGIFGHSVADCRSKRSQEIDRAIAASSDVSSSNVPSLPAASKNSKPWQSNSRGKKSSGCAVCHQWPLRSPVPFSSQT